MTGRFLVSCVASAMLTLASGAAVRAATFDYMTIPGALLRAEDAKAIWVQSDRAGAAWRTVFTAGEGQLIGGLSCDRATGAVCFARLVTADGRSVWRPLRLGGSAAPDWSELNAPGASIVDVDDGAGLALVLIERGPLAQPAGAAPGVYLWKRGQDFADARRLAGLETACLNAARFVRVGGQPNVFVSKGCGAGGQRGAWIVMSAAGDTIAAPPPMGLPIALQGDDLYFLARIGPGAGDQTVYRFRVPVGPPGRWVGGVAYKPDAAAERPAILHAGPEAFPSSAVVVGDRIVGVANTPGGPSLFAVCAGNDGEPASRLNAAGAAMLGPVGELQVASQGGGIVHGIAGANGGSSCCGPAPAGAGRSRCRRCPQPTRGLPRVLRSTPRCGRLGPTMARCCLTPCWGRRAVMARS